MVAESLQMPSKGRNPAVLLLRLPLRVLVAAVFLLVLGIRFLLRSRTIRYGLLVVAVGGAVAWSSFGSQLFPTLPSRQAVAETVSVPVSTQLPQSTAVERYLKGQAEYDAAAMWDTMGDKFRRRMGSSSNSMEQLQAQLDSSRSRDQHYSAATYVGGAKLDKGGAVYLYILSVTSPSGSAQLPFTFTVDQDGKISNIQ